MGDLVHFPRQPVREPWLPKRALANHWGCSVKTIERYMAQKMPHDHGPNGYARFRLSEVEPWREERKAS